MSDKIKDLKNENLGGISESKLKEVSANIDQMNVVPEEHKPAGDLYGKAEAKDSETGVIIPTDESVEDAKKWADEENQR